MPVRLTEAFKTPLLPHQPQDFGKSALSFRKDSAVRQPLVLYKRISTIQGTTLYCWTGIGVWVIYQQVVQRRLSQMDQHSECLKTHFRKSWETMGTGNQCHENVYLYVFGPPAKPLNPMANPLSSHHNHSGYNLGHPKDSWQHAPGDIYTIGSIKPMERSLGKCKENLRTTIFSFLLQRGMEDPVKHLNGILQ